MSASSRRRGWGHARGLRSWRQGRRSVLELSTRSGSAAPSSLPSGGHGGPRATQSTRAEREPREAVGGEWRTARRGRDGDRAVGVLVQPDLEPRILRWAAVRRVHVEMIHGRDGGTPTTLWSVVTIETEHERFAGRAAGAIAIERLVAHVDAYADEQAHAIALDLDGRRAADGPHEPVIESLLAAARTSAVGGRDGTRLGLPMGYRRAGAGASSETMDVLRSVCASRAPRTPDPRALAAVLAAELGASPLARELQSLVHHRIQSSLRWRRPLPGSWGSMRPRSAP